MDRGHRPRSPERGYPPPRDTDSYVPGGRSRPRSRSPPRHRGRSRSPPRPVIDSYRGSSRRYEAPVDTYAPRARSPRPDYYGDRVPPPRERSPLGLKRGRDLSPGRGIRSTPPMKRERLASPPREYGRPRSPPRNGGYRPRSRSPRRDDRVDPYAVPSWRRRSPEMRSRGGSAVSSRRSSPRPYPRPNEGYPTESHRGVSGSYASPRPRSPPRREPPPPHARSPYREENPYANHARPLPEHDYPPNGSAYPSREGPAPGDYRERPPPTGPSAALRDPYAPTAAGPPSGPSATPVSMSAHNRPGSTYPPPARGGHPSSRGRGGPPPPRDYPGRDFSGPPPPRRGSAYGAPSYGRGAPSPRDYGAPYESRGPPRRESFGVGGFSRGGAGGGSSTSLTTPRTQRFNTHLADLPKIKDGGEKLPLPYDTGKADKLEEEAAKIRKMIDEKESKKRQGLREWENLEREASTAALRSELAEDHLRSLNGEDSVSAAAF